MAAWIPVPICLTFRRMGSESASRPPRSSVPYSIPFHVIAHRGASAYAPENTLPAFELAHRMGAFEVEIDVVLSSDDEVALFHDTQMDTKTNRTGVPRDYTLAELLDTDIGTWFDKAHPEVEVRYAGTGLISLKQLFETMGRSLYYHIELKDDQAELPRRTLDVIEAAGLRDRVMMTSFRLEQLRRFRALDAQVPICWLLPGNYLEGIDQALAEGFQQVGIPVRDLSEENVSVAQSKGLEARVWYITSDEDMDLAIRLGANGMTTNWPDRLIARVVRDLGAPDTALGS
ncbi:hypothetical protein MK489_18635 [Myxococcota bacterium]|nr:hypothetical protein [Myxococcota bacterium]